MFTDDEVVCAPTVFRSMTHEHQPSKLYKHM